MMVKAMMRLVALAVFLLSPFGGAISMANDIKTVEGEYTFLGDGRHSPAECKRLAAEGARIQALKNEFGAVLSQDIMQTESVKGDSEASHFLSLSSSEVKGEWLGDIGEPVYDVSLDDDANLVVRCKVKGRAKALNNKAAEFEALVLRNGTDQRNADTNFRHGDRMYLYFSAPVNGFLSVFLADEQDNVFQILPYSTGDVAEVRTRKGYDYIFFDSRRGTDFGNVDELIMTAPDGEEFNKVYVVFSPEAFAPPAVKFKYAGAPPVIDREEFAKWLVKVRRNDERMGVRSMNLMIAPSGKKTESIRY
ncbi:MAG: DUF4384 domain-containing protein [Muribaculaceae bacterium]|nr:DUF4384 domain-containing protein [Muribaculaceae bacterium]